MSSIVVGLVVLACVFISAIVGMYAGSVMPQHRLDSESRDTMKLATGLIATLAALVLGLLVSAAKETFDKTDNELKDTAITTVQLDRLLAQYGPETKEIREMVKNSYSIAVNMIASGDESMQAKLDSPEAVARFESVQIKIRSLSPENDSQRDIKARSLDMFAELSDGRWFLILQGKGSISIPLLVILILWLCTIFAAWGVFAPRNRVVTSALFACALSAACAVFLMLEMDRPLTGLIKVSSSPMQMALSHLGQ